MYQELDRVLGELKKEIQKLSHTLDIRDVTDFRYETIILSSYIENRKGKEGARRFQLKGIVYSGGRQKHETIKSWTHEAPIALLRKLIFLYRGARYLKKAIEHLEIATL